MPRQKNLWPVHLYLLKTQQRVPQQTQKEIFSLYLEKGGYEIIFSFTGYNTRTINAEGSNQQITVALSKADNTMAEVIIKSSNELEDGWERYGDFFLKHLLCDKICGQLHFY
jgi:hypothetical protein